MEIQFTIPLVNAKSNPASRKRHVKCDETRPACLNCIKWRGYCDSYADSPTGDGRADNAQLIHTKKAPLILTEPSVNTIRFTTEDQRSYFDEWAALSVSFLSGGLSQTRLWTATMPQLTLEESTLRYGAMAVGALRRACGPQNSPALLTTDNRHYLNAVVFYCEALRMQSKATPSKDGLRTALLSSLLFICFEAQRGNTPAALKHIVHGFSMLNELAGCTSNAPHLVRIAAAPPAMVQEILDCYKPLELQSRSFMGSYAKHFFANKPQAGSAASAAATAPGMPSPQRSSISSPPSDPETPQSRSSVSAGLPSPQSQSQPSPQNQGTSPAAQSPPPRPPGIAPFTKHSPYFRPRQSNITSMQDMPRAFSNMEEAQGYWSLVQKNMVQYMPLLTATSRQLALPKSRSEAEVEAKLTTVRQNPKMISFIADSKYWIQRWIEAYEPLYQSFVRNADSEPTPYLNAINLRIEYLVLYIYTTVPRYSGLITAQGLTPQYREINVLAETLLRARPNCGFAMDSGWTWPLFISAFGCRDPAVRADAMRILDQYPIRNALRDSRVFRAIALRNEEAERAIAQEGDESVQWVRIRRREVLFEDFGASVVVRLPRKDPVTNEWELVEEAADFSVSQNGQLSWKRQPISDATSMLGGVC
ncbi:hypothetical protein K4F52_005647 [Lecanicillium sp. MT-2017a]|nr:hypothetical protein K4F52_005647 [Lecanicillium sp. MT-2017a]